VTSFAYRNSAPPPRAGIFRRRMILQLTSLLDLMLILVFVQYLEMQEVSARAISEQTRLRQAAQSQRDRLLSGRRDLYEVWQIHLNGNKSLYPDGSILLSTDTVRKVIQARNREDFLSQLIAAVQPSPRPPGRCMILLTWGNVRRDVLDETRAELQFAAADQSLRQAWGVPAVQFQVVEGGLLEGAGGN
jgi:hypothetical protein